MPPLPLLYVLYRNCTSITLTVPPVPLLYLHYPYYNYTTLNVPPLPQLYLYHPHCTSSNATVPPPPLQLIRYTCYTIAIPDISPPPRLYLPCPSYASRTSTFHCHTRPTNAIHQSTPKSVISRPFLCLLVIKVMAGDEASSSVWDAIVTFLHSASPPAPGAPLRPNSAPPDTGFPA